MQGMNLQGDDICFQSLFLCSNQLSAVAFESDLVFPEIKRGDWMEATVFV